ncbi:hypothetical protein BDZ91DRAFT_68121 [Kalaharituber pfeilii]|nr:hypothetical protein BDZ91DRAFT_68121 [Kalaharituber pfeilii]
MPPPTPPSSIAQLNTGFGKAAFILEEGIEFDEGRIHVIDALFTPAGSFIEGLEEAGFVELGNIFDTRFPALRAELDTASHLTFFAPARYVLEDARPELSGLSDSELEALINYHTLDLTTGFIGYTTSLECGKIYKTKGGGKVVVTFNGLDTYINDAKIIGRDLILQNGVMHVLDKILELQSPEATTLPGPNGTVIDINNIQGCTTPTPTPEVAGNATNTPTYRPPQQTGSAEATRGSPLKTVIAAFAAVGLTLF